MPASAPHSLQANADHCLHRTRGTGWFNHRTCRAKTLTAPERRGTSSRPRNSRPAARRAAIPATGLITKREDKTPHELSREGVD